MVETPSAGLFDTVPFSTAIFEYEDDKLVNTAETATPIPTDWEGIGMETYAKPPFPSNYDDAIGEFSDWLPSLEDISVSGQLLGTSHFGVSVDLEHQGLDQPLAENVTTTLVNAEDNGSDQMWLQRLYSDKKSSERSANTYFSANPDPKNPSTRLRQQVHSRSLPRRRSRYALQMPSSTSHAEQFPGEVSYMQDDSQMQLWDPLDRWRNSPPEEEPVTAFSIKNALENISAEPRRAGLPSQRPYFKSSSRHANLSPPRAKSVTSHDSFTSDSSTGTTNSARSARSAFSGRHKLTGRIRKRIRDNRSQRHDELRIFKCTFCCDTFKRKYDWTRHEKSLHLNVDGWKCAPHGAFVISPGTNRVVCAYCNVLDPTHGHLDTHNVQACQDEHTPAKIFRRKDHLVQHLRLVHQLESLPFIDDWKIDSPSISSRCGFCGSKFTDWNERQEHLTKHFRNGKTMDDWRGEHNFEPHIAELITYSMPPYLIGAESKSFIPFSATSAGTKDHRDQISSFILDRSSPGEVTANSIAADVPTTSNFPIPSDNTQAFTDMLTLHLGKFARQQISLGIVPTDEMFQNESRKVLYGGDDTWDQTIADNADWLAAFRKGQDWT